MGSELAAAVLLFTLAGASFSLVLISRGRRPRRVRPRLFDIPLIDDPDRLQRAEAEARAAGFALQDLVVVATFRSEDGFLEHDLAKIVIYLGSEDIQASYLTVHTGLVDRGGRWYRLLVPQHQAEKAQSLIVGRREQIFTH